ncbi:MAG: hypothetical protein DRJ52_05120 [Thermoprotei archaeon]|nr:MAG: hypothetical protein DRJ52_05120 [Thermoprotei archaeon]RLE99938.1 MAG: hypothetical protein DRJ63_03770 [Thermoprotei archaeon]
MFSAVRDRLSRIERDRLSGAYDSLVAVLSELDGSALKYFSKRLSKVGISATRGFSRLVLPVFVFSLVDSFSPRFRMTTRSVVREYMALVDVLGDPEDRASYYVLPEEVEVSFDSLKWISRLDDLAKARLARAVALVAEVVFTGVEGLEDFAEKLCTAVMSRVGELYSPVELEKKSAIVGMLLKSVSLGEPVEILRLSVLSLPGVEQRLANLFLYYLVKVILGSSQYFSSLHVPVEPQVSRPAVRVGLVPSLPTNPNFLSSRYREFQEVSKIMFPEDPSAVYSLKLVGMKYCRRTPLCDHCPLFPTCDYALKISE